MIKVEKMDVFNFDGAIRGMRNPLNSWDKSDSSIGDVIYVGENDLSLMRRLYQAGSEHRKYLRQIMVCMDITAPRLWWTEFDTYKVGVTADSCSTMHTIHKKPFDYDDFSCDHYNNDSMLLLGEIIEKLNLEREIFLKTKNVKAWEQMIYLLPQSYNQKRTVTMNYENVMNMINQRSNHKLSEWRQFVNILKDLPYIEAIRQDNHD